VFLAGSLTWLKTVDVRHINSCSHVAASNHIACSRARRISSGMSGRGLAFVLEAAAAFSPPPADRPTSCYRLISGGLEHLAQAAPRDAIPACCLAVPLKICATSSKCAAGVASRLPLLAKRAHDLHHVAARGAHTRRHAARDMPPTTTGGSPCTAPNPAVRQCHPPKETRQCHVLAGIMCVSVFVNSSQ